MTDFFEHQEQARRNTRTLVALFAVAVTVIGIALYLVVRVFQYWALVQSHGPYGASRFPLAWWDPGDVLLMITGTFILVGGLSLARIASLREGGATVARLMGGIPVEPSTTDPGERRLRNVVEEMAIASGTPVPQVFVLDEPAINAFAAGWSPNDAAVAVTRGALRALDRDQLQGVVAHEFSHILNGDMRLNLHMIGVLFGILAIALAGRWIMGARRAVPRRGGGGIFLAGLALWVIGYIGVFVGRILQAAISRQREYLADASAVQFTRNPDGIAGALKRIAGLDAKSYLLAPDTEEVRHLLFGEGTALGLLDRIFATHPPLPDRIRRLDPSFDGTVEPVTAVELARGVAVASVAPAAVRRVAGPGASTGAGARLSADQVVGRVGAPDPETLAATAAAWADLPPVVGESLQTAAGAAKVICAILVGDDGAERAAQFGILQETLGEGIVPEVLALRRALASLGEAGRLPLVERAVPALRRADEGQRHRFLNLVDALIAADRQVSLFEFVTRRLLERRLAAPRREVGLAYRSVDRVAWNVGQVLAALAQAGQPGDAAAAGKAFRAGLDRLPTSLAPRILEAWNRGDLGTFEAVGSSLDRLRLATPSVKAVVVGALAHCVMDDGVVTVAETDLLRVVSVSMDCPMPPFPRGSSPASA